MPTAHIYVRVSTDKQELSPEWQRNVCLTYYQNNLKQRGFELGEVYEDLGKSAFKISWQDRPAGQELFRAAQPGDCIVVAKQDRAFRSVRDRENTAFYCQQMKIGLVILDAQLDTTTAAGTFAAGIIALQSQWESQVKSERMKAAHAVRRQRKSPYRAYPPPGWKYDKIIKEFLPDAKERALLADIYKRHKAGVRSVTESAQWLRHHDIKRDCGTKYDSAWLFRAYMNYTAGWPQQGYLRSTHDKASQEQNARRNVGPFPGKRRRAKPKCEASQSQTSPADPVLTSTTSAPDEC